MHNSRPISSLPNSQILSFGHASFIKVSPPSRRSALPPVYEHSSRTLAIELRLRVGKGVHTRQFSNQADFSGLGEYLIVSICLPSSCTGLLVSGGRTPMNCERVFAIVVRGTAPGWRAWLINSLQGVLDISESVLLLEEVPKFHHCPCQREIRNVQ